MEIQTGMVEMGTTEPHPLQERAAHGDHGD